MLRSKMQKMHKDRDASDEMSADLETSSSATALASASPNRRLPVLKYSLALTTVVSLCSSAFLTYLWWDVADWLQHFAFVCLFAVLIFLMISLVRRRWKDAGIFVAVWLIALAFGPLGADLQQQNWLAVQGFRIHASPVQKYLSKCKLIEFVENGIKQTVGECEGHGDDEMSFDDSVIYDTTGNLLKPASEQSPQWKRVMDAFFGPQVLASSRERTRHIWGDFYDVSTNYDEERG